MEYLIPILKIKVLNQRLRRYSAVAACLLCILQSCVKDKPAVANSELIRLSGSDKVYVINEGNFGSGNSSVSLYDPASGQVVENIYRQVNGSDVGDVAQSLGFWNDKFFLVVNNSGKLVVCDRSFKTVTQLKGLVSPRYLCRVTNQKAYLSDFKSNAIAVIDLNQAVKSASIPCPGWTERMEMIYNKVYVTNVRRNFVYVINTLTDAITDSVYVGPNASSLVLDRNDHLWVLSGGDSARQVAPRLSRINTLNNQAELQLDFGPGRRPGNLCLNGGGDTLYYLDGGIYRLSVNATLLPASAFVLAGGRNYYGLGVHPRSFTVYAADALDFSQKSNVYLFNADGTPKGYFKAGINANGFYFE